MNLIRRYVRGDSYRYLHSPSIIHRTATKASTSTSIYRRYMLGFIFYHNNQCWVAEPNISPMIPTHWITIYVVAERTVERTRSRNSTNFPATTIRWRSSKWEIGKKGTWIRGKGNWLRQFHNRKIFVENMIVNAILTLETNIICQFYVKCNCLWICQCQ